VTFQGEKVGGSHSVHIDFRKSDFLGFVNHGTPITGQGTGAFGRPVEIVLTENKILSPLFTTSNFKSDITLQTGQYLLTEGGTTSKSLETLKSADNFEKPDTAVLGHFVALIQVE